MKNQLKKQKYFIRDARDDREETRREASCGARIRNLG